MSPLYIIDGVPYGVPPADDRDDTVAVYAGERLVAVEYDVGDDEPVRPDWAEWAAAL
jgi:hypothetical protein